MYLKLRPLGKYCGEQVEELGPHSYNWEHGGFVHWQLVQCVLGFFTMSGVSPRSGRWALGLSGMSFRSKSVPRKLLHFWQTGPNNPSSVH